MGYCVTMDCSGVTVSKDNVEKALAAVKATAQQMDKMNGGSYQGGVTVAKWFAWVDIDSLVGATTLKDALRAWRYNAVANEDGSVEVDYFRGEKLGDDSVLWKALAPFVDPEGVIYCTGEDDFHWKWTFKGGSFKEVSGKIVYEGE